MKFFEKLSSDLQKELPDVKSFSVTNLKYMKYFRQMYCRNKNRQQVVDERIFHIPLGHHSQILGKYKENQGKAISNFGKILPDTQSDFLSNRKPDTTVKLSVDMEDYYRIKMAKNLSKL